MGGGTLAFAVHEAGQVESAASMRPGVAGAPRIRSHTSGSIANNGVWDLSAIVTSTHGVIHVQNDAATHYGIFMLRGGVNLTTEMLDAFGNMSVTSGTAGSVNIYYSAGYKLENKSGSARTFSILEVTNG